jgi:hypothetical protein
VREPGAPAEPGWVEFVAHAVTKSTHRAGGSAAEQPRSAAVRAHAAGPSSAPGAGAAARAPVVRQMVVFRSGRAIIKRVSTRKTLVRVGGRRCAAGDGTALAALVRGRPGRVRLRDFGSCSRRPRDGAGLFVSAIGRDRNRGQDGWVYKVGRRAATAGAADPAGPFGSGPLREGQRVTWFYCRMRAGGCQRTLAVRASSEPGGLLATVRGHDDEGRAIAIEGATVRAGGASAVTGPDGGARLALAPGSYRVVAIKDGLVRSFAERAVVR